MEIKRLPADEAMRLVTSMIKTDYIVELTGLSPSIISQGQNHSIVKGKPFYYKERHLLLLRNAVKYVIKELLYIKISDNKDILSQLKELGNIVRLPYIFQNIMGKTEFWVNKRISQKVNTDVRKECSMLEEFTSDEVLQINDAIRIIALTLLSIEITTDYKHQQKTLCSHLDSNITDGSCNCTTLAPYGDFSDKEPELIIQNEDEGKERISAYKEEMFKKGIEAKRLPADEAMRLVTSMIKNNYVAEVTNMLPNVISRGQSHTVMNGKPFYYTERHLSLLRAAIKFIGEELLSVEILDNGDVLAQLVELRKKVCLPYIFQTVMGKSEDWQKKRMSQQVHCRKAGREYSMLGKFTSDEVRQINDAIRIIALTLLSVELTTDYEPLP